MARQVVITGTGRGKSMLALMLSSHYSAEGVEHEIIHVGSQAEAEAISEQAAGLQVIVSNVPLSLKSPWQEITVNGGYPDEAA